MTRKGYPKGFSAGVVASFFCFRPYHSTEYPLCHLCCHSRGICGKAFPGGFLPGFLIAFFLMAMVYFTALKRNFPREEKTNFPKIWVAAKGGFSAIFAPVVILGGIVVGIFTPTEAGAIAVAYAIVFGFIYGNLTLGDLPKVLVESVYTTALLMFIISTASVFGWILVNERFSDVMTNFLFSLSQNKWTIMLIINLILLLLGCFMETVSILIISVPVFVPIIIKLGFDPVYFGVVLTLNLMIGTLTPPVGLVLYIVAHLSGLSLTRAIQEILPFYIPLLVSLIIITLFPGITMFLPNLLMK